MKIKRSDFEIIVVDDYSTDDTLEVLGRLKTVGVKNYRNKRNSGATVSRNNGAKLATGDFLFFLDFDTEIDPDILERFDEVTRQVKGLGMIAPIIYYYGEKNRIWYTGAWINMLTSQAYYEV